MKKQKIKIANGIRSAEEIREAYERLSYKNEFYYIHDTILLQTEEGEQKAKIQ